MRFTFCTGILLVCAVAGCTPSQQHRANRLDVPVARTATPPDPVVQLAAFKEPVTPAPTEVTAPVGTEEESLPSLNHQHVTPLPAPRRLGTESLQSLEQQAASQNPAVVRLYRQYQAASARSSYVDKLPDPRVGGNIFAFPIETAAGSQRANMTISQTIPWLERLNAQQQRACLEALAILAEYRAEQLKVIAGVRVGWFRLQVLDKQIEITGANQKLLKSLIEVANARIATGNAAQGDVLLGTLELSRLEERLLSFRRQRKAVEAEINRLTARPSDTAITPSAEIAAGLPSGTVESILQMTLQAQPEIEAARLRTQATRWGVQVARLQRRPEFTLSTSLFFTEGNRPPTPVVNVGEDPWAFGLQVSVPVWREKYDAMEREALWKHQAAHSTVDDLRVRYDAIIFDLMAEAKRSAETASLYQSTILPQARQTLSADQQAYITGGVEFDRVIRDYRSLLTLELGWHQARGDLAIAHARLSQIAGTKLPVVAEPERIPAPDVDEKAGTTKAEEREVEAVDNPPIGGSP